MMDLLKRFTFERTTATRFRSQQDKTPLSFLSIPAEIRVRIYKHLLPPQVQPMDYAGLRRSCKLVCKEFDYEASKNMQEEFKSFRAFLRKENIILETGVIDMFATNTLSIIIPISFFRTLPAVPPIMIPFHWSWIRSVYITVPANGYPSRQASANFNNWMIDIDEFVLDQEGPCGMGRDASQIHVIDIALMSDLIYPPPIPTISKMEWWQNKLFLRWQRRLPRWKNSFWHDGTGRINAASFRRREAPRFRQALLYLFGMGLVAVFAGCFFVYIAGKLSVFAVGRIAALIHHCRSGS